MEPALGAALALAVGIAAMIVVVVLAARSSLRSRVARVRAQRAVLGERRAAALLEAAGFAIEGAQVPARYALVVDGGERWFDVRADYVVWRGDERWIAEVKTGDMAPRLELPATRRQLLEYGLAFDAAGVLLVDVEAERIHAIELPWRARERAQARRSDAPMRVMSLAGVFIGCAIVGTIVALLR